MYQDMYQRLSHNLPAVPPAAAPYAPDQSASYGAPRYGGLDQVSPPQAARTPAQPSFTGPASSYSKTLAGAPSLGGPGSRSAAGRR